MEFLQQHQLRATCRRRADAVFRHLEVVIAIIRAWLLHDADAQHSALVRRFARRLVAWRFCLGLAHGALGICMDTQCRLPYCAISARQSMPITSRSGKHGRRRSEEHTSELQSLMRISYAVYCLKK